MTRDFSKYRACVANAVSDLLSTPGVAAVTVGWEDPYTGQQLSISLSINNPEHIKQELPMLDAELTSVVFGGNFLAPAPIPGQEDNLARAFDRIRIQAKLKSLQAQIKPGSLSRGEKRPRIELNGTMEIVDVGPFIARYDNPSIS